MIADRLPHRFSRVYGVPTGGERLAEALSVYEDPFANRTLVVDDVWTTGKSIIEAMHLQNGHMAAVIFARTATTPDWVTSLFNMKEGN